MPHSYGTQLLHIVFSTKERTPFLDEDLRPRLFAYMSGIVQQKAGHALLINGVPDHVHMLVRMAAIIALADFMRVIKANASKWVHDSIPGKTNFAWQTGYAYFSVSHSNSGAVAKYIAEQQEHHRRMSFKDELLGLLRKHQIEFDEHYLWD